MRQFLDRAHLPELVIALQQAGYRVIGPTVHDGAIVYDDLASDADLPAGWTDRQEAGTYGLERRDDDAVFGFVVGPHTWKRHLHPPQAVVWSGTISADTFVEDPAEPAPRVAFLGVRPCEVAAIAVQDRVFLGDRFRDRVYGERRANCLIVAVDCTEPGGTCFCASMGTGPRADAGFDVGMTELVWDGGHGFLVEPGSEEGAAVLERLPLREATQAEVALADERLGRAVEQMGRHLDTGGIKDLLYRNAGHPRWETTAQRCLACANCTMVCPTCFCATVTDEPSLDGASSARVRRWDSCFNLEFSYMHGGPLRTSGAARYRQWMTHKLATWIDQFGTSGCVGCGRCITWCPVGIDITEEVAAIRETEEDARVRARPTP